MENQEMKVYHRVKKVLRANKLSAKYGGEVYATHKPQPTRMDTRTFVFIETFYESKEEAEKAIRTINRID